MVVFMYILSMRETLMTTTSLLEQASKENRSVLPNALVCHAAARFRSITAANASVAFQQLRCAIKGSKWKGVKISVVQLPEGEFRLILTGYAELLLARRPGTIIVNWRDADERLTQFYWRICARDKTVNKRIRLADHETPVRRRRWRSKKDWHVLMACAGG